MSADHDKGPLLGQQVTGSQHYDPTLLFPVPRDNARASLPDGQFSGFGADIWHAYELSWLDSQGMPAMFLGTFSIPATSPNLVESKSLKLYLNALNSHRFDSELQAQTTIIDDVSRVVDAPVALSLDAVNNDAYAGAELSAASLDQLRVSPAKDPDAQALTRRDGDDYVYTHLMRSLCPVTAQPDWATVIIESRGARLDRRQLLAYLLAYRDHQEFHEQCVERIYSDLHTVLAPDFLSVQALYTRRGGLDICPWRCSEDRPAPRWRLNRQ